MPPKFPQGKTKRSLLKSILHFLSPCSGDRAVLDDLPIPPRIVVHPPPDVLIDEQKPKRRQKGSQPQNKPKVVDDLDHSRESKLPSNLREDPCESVPRTNDQECAIPPPHSDPQLETHHAQELRDDDSESRTSASSASATLGTDPVNLAVERVSILKGANRFSVGQITYNEAPKSQGPSYFVPRALAGWEVLSQAVAIHALHNSKKQHGLPKCEERTRVEVLAEIMAWLANYRSLEHLLCVTGSGGAGKSTLQRTIAEQLSKMEATFATFFFSKDDPDRNNISYIIPTIAFQFGLRHPTLKHLMGTAMADDPHLLEKSLHAQVGALLIDPIEHLLSGEGFEYEASPYIVLIDGLNDCLDEGPQEELLTTISDCMLNNDHPHFRLILSSRIGSAIKTIFTPQGDWPKHIYHVHFTMDEAVTDIGRMSWKRLQSDSKGRQKASRRRTTISIRVPATAALPGASWRQRTTDLSKDTAQRRSRSLPPLRTLAGPFYVSPAPTPLINSSSDAEINFPQPVRSLTGALQAWYVEALLLPETFMHGQDPEDVPGSAATDDLYPPSPMPKNSPTETEGSMAQGRGEAVDTQRAGTPDRSFETLALTSEAKKPPLVLAPTLVGPKPIRAFAPNEDDLLHSTNTPWAHESPSFPRYSVDPLSRPHSRSPPPTFLGDPGRILMPGRCASADGIIYPRGKGKRRRQTVGESFFRPPDSGTAGLEGAAHADEEDFLRSRKRQKVPSEIPHGSTERTQEMSDID